MKNDNNIPKPTLTIKHGRISIGVQPEKEYILTPDEETAISYIFDMLKENDVDISTLCTEHTKEYLKLSAEKYYCFCRLKLSGTLKYVSVPLSLRESKLLKSDPRFLNVDFDTKNFTRIPISEVDDILNYMDIIFNSFKYAYITNKEFNREMMKLVKLNQDGIISEKEFKKEKSELKKRLL